MSGADVLWIMLAAATMSGEVAAPLDTPMIGIPGGRVVMGDPAGEPDEAVHELEVAPFSLMTTEVTNAAFAAFVAETGHVTDAERNGGGYVWPGSWRFETGADWRHPEGPRDSIEGRAQHPVVQVSRNDAAGYCAHHGLRLPSEAEWVSAARGFDRRRFPWGDEPPLREGAGRANFGTVKCCALDESDGYRHSAPVGSFPAGRSPFGLEDMAGNVWEWTSTDHEDEAVIKGGGFGNNPYALRIGIRHKSPPPTALDMVGFRCAGN